MLLWALATSVYVTTLRTSLADRGDRFIVPNSNYSTLRKKKTASLRISYSSTGERLSARGVCCEVQPCIEPLQSQNVHNSNSNISKTFHVTQETATCETCVVWGPLPFRQSISMTGMFSSVGRHTDRTIVTTNISFKDLKPTRPQHLLQ